MVEVSILYVAPIWSSEELQGRVIDPIETDQHQVTVDTSRSGYELILINIATKMTKGLRLQVEDV